MNEEDIIQYALTVWLPIYARHYPGNEVWQVTEEGVRDLVHKAVKLARLPEGTDSLDAAHWNPKACIYSYPVRRETDSS